MKKIAIFGKSKENSNHLKSLANKSGLVIDGSNPDIVISYGGDGTFLVSEREFPGIPKVLIRDSKICNKCHNNPTDHILEKILKNDYKINELIKLKASINNYKSLICTNDFVIRNKMPTHALRFRLWINDKEVDDEFIGDGIVISTVFGSTGYYYSVTKQSFNKGVGVAFNNITKKAKHLVLKENDIIKVQVTRGDAVLVADNDPRIIDLLEKDVIEMKKSDDVARLINIE